MARIDNLTHFLTDIADAIRTKGGTSATIQASSFDTAIANLPSGGGTTEVGEKDVNFYDYDGTRLHSYTKTEFLALNSLPDNPTHEGLTAQGWNWTLSDAKDFVTTYGELDIGQYFVTNDGATRIYVNFNQKERLNPYLCFGLNGTATIDWGDNTTDVVTGTDLNTLVKTQHTYSNPGEYVISISGDEILFTSAGNSISTIFTMDNTITTNLQENVFIKSIFKIELGSNFKTIDNYAFKSLRSLKIITTSTYINSFSGVVAFQDTSINYYLFPNLAEVQPSAFSNNISLETIVFPKIITGTGSQAFNNCYNLKKLTINNISSASSLFNNCYNLKKIIGAFPVTQLTNSMFYNCSSLTKFTAPSTLTRIRSYAFAGCLSLKEIDFTQSTAVPTLDNINVFNYVPTDCKFIVPDSLYSTWTTANNWSNFASQIVKESQA